jgi:hypothetical protein
VDSAGNPLKNPAGSGNPVVSSDANVQKVVSYFTHSTSGASAFPKATLLSQADLGTLLEAEAKASFIPTCAMQVQRTAEVGGEASYQPKEGCGCYFESITGGGTTLSSYCKTATPSGGCKTASDCTNASYPACNFGYCEAQ